MNYNLIYAQLDELCNITPQHALYAQSVAELELCDFQKKNDNFDL